MSIKRHFSLNIAGGVVPLALSLVTLPVYLNAIGEERYGVLAIVWVLLGYFRLFDLGLGRATAQRIAALDDDVEDRRASAFWTAVVLNVLLGLVGAILIWIVAVALFSTVIKVDGMIAREVLDALPWLALALPLIMLISVLTGALQGWGRFLELNVISVVGEVVFQVVLLSVALYLSPELQWVLPAAVSARLITTLLFLQRCVALVGRFRSTFLSRSEALRLLPDGGLRRWLDAVRSP